MDYSSEPVLVFSEGGGYKRLIINYIGPIVLILWIVAAGVFDGGQFIYFQF